MALSSALSADGHATVIRISGVFDFSVHREMREAYRNVDRPGHVFKLDLSEAEYIDSAALGMMLLLREHAERHQASVSIVCGRAPVRRILELAKFDLLFNIAD